MKMKSLIASSIILALSACNDNSVSPEVGNSPGTVSLSGDSIIGSTLTSVITDGNGVDSASVTYTWLADDVVIAGANTSSYTLTAAEENTKVSLTATYIDTDGYSELVKSAPTATVEYPAVQTPGSVAISGNAYEGSVLTAVITDENGSGATPIVYVWMADGVVIADADKSSYTLTTAELGATITVSATYTDNDGFAEDLISLPTEIVIENPGGPEVPEGSITQAAAITDSDASVNDTGELRYKFDNGTTTGKVSLAMLYAEGETESAYVSLFDTANSTASLIGELRLDEGNITLRGEDTQVTTFTPGEWLDIEMTWNTSSTSEAGTYTVKIDGSSYGPYTSQNTRPGVEVTATTVKFSSNSGTAETTLYVDDFMVFADEDGFTAPLLNDDFESYLVGDSLDAAPYNSSTYSAVVAEVARDVDVPEVDHGLYASITDNMTDDAGELRYKHGSTIEAGKLSVSFAKDEVVTADGTPKEAYIALYGSSTSTNNAMVDLRIGNGNFTIRNQDGIDVAATFTPGEWVDVEMTWDATNASSSVAPLVTITINGTSVTVEAFPSISADLNSVADGVQTLVFKLSDTSSTVTGAYLVDDIRLYSDIAGTTIAFEDDFESYNPADSLDTDNSSSPYNSSTAEAVVAGSNGSEPTPEPEPEPEPEPSPGATKVASITDNMTDDAGELRYKNASAIAAGKLTASFAKDEVMTADGTPKEAYIALYGSSTSTSKAMVDLRIGNGTFTIRDQADIDVTATFTPGEWVDVEMTWDATNASSSVAPLVTITINGTAVTVEAFSSVSSELDSVMDGVKTVVFKLSDTSSTVTGAYLVDDIKLYSDIAGTSLVFEDDFESYGLGDSLDSDNSSSPYDSSTAEAVVAEAMK